MIRMSTFKRGGVHPHDKKELSKNSPMEILPVPETLVVPMSQHIGAPAKVLKKKGDPVMTQTQKIFCHLPALLKVIYRYGS